MGAHGYPDGSPWLAFPSNLDRYGIPNTLGPWHYDEDAASLEFRMVGSSRALWEVIVDEAQGTTRFVDPEAPWLLFISWDDYLLDSIIGLRPENPLRADPNPDASVILEDAIIEALEVRDDWLHARGSYIHEEDSTIVGWVRWRSPTGDLLVYLYDD